MDLTPKCPRCGTRLWERTGAGDHLWVCGRFPECDFEVMDSTIQEAIRRQRVARSASVVRTAPTRAEDTVRSFSPKAGTAR